jgi:hypothetical protein
LGCPIEKKQESSTTASRKNDLITCSLMVNRAIINLNNYKAL